MMFLRRLPLKGVYNLRDLGGYPAGEGKATKWKLFFRADGLFGLESSDFEYVMNYCKIKTVIDLRSTGTLSERPNSFASVSGIRYENVPLISESRSREQIMADWETLNGGYIAIAKHSKGLIKRVFDIICETLPEPMVFHCTAGKDRTGIIASLILGACGVNISDIVADYEVSYTYIKEDLERSCDPGTSPSMVHFASRAETILGFIDFVMTEHGSITQFLLDCGVSGKKIEELKANFLVDITGE